MTLVSRRIFVLVLGAHALSTPWISSAQTRPTKPVRIGFLGGSDTARFQGQVTRFRTRMHELGYVEGKNLVLEVRNAGGRYERLEEVAAELASLKVDVIVSTGTDAAKAAQKATVTIPIVATSVADPLASGLVKSLARPGGNITGFAGSIGEVVVKHVEMLQSLVPKIARIAVLLHPDNTSHVVLLRNAEAAATKIGARIIKGEVRAAHEIEPTFAMLAQQNPQGLIVLPDAFFNQVPRQIAEAALRHRLPSIGRYVGEGLLLSYATIDDQYQRAAVLVDKILKGAKPADLPVEQPMRFSMVLNGRTAKALGITIPPDLMLRVDRVIE